MPNVTRRSFATRAVAVAATTAAALGVVAFTAPSAGATTSTLVTITKLGTHRLPALTGNQLITVTGTGFDEAVITDVDVTGCTAPTYIVQTTTTLLVKTDATCTAGLAAVVTITDSATNTAVSVPGAVGGAQALDFIAAPSIVTMTAALNPATTENSTASAYANEVTAVSTKGGAVVRVTAGGTAFVNSTQYPLSATLGGVALKTVVMPVGGAYFTGAVGAHAADAAPVLRITSNGVSKSFVYAAVGGTTAGTHSLQYAGVGIVVTPASGLLSGGNVLTVTGSGFTVGTTATVGGVACPVSGTTTATVFKCTVAGIAAAGPKTVVTTTGSVSSVVSAGSTYTFLDQ